MFDIGDLLRVKKMQLERLRQEIAALRIVAPLLHEDLDDLKKDTESERVATAQASTGVHSGMGHSARLWPLDGPRLRPEDYGQVNVGEQQKKLAS